MITKYIHSGRYRWIVIFDKLGYSDWTNAVRPWCRDNLSDIALLGVSAVVCENEADALMVYLRWN